ncbi:MAG: hypothetical protein AAF564_25330, partial [Bacteroidota bacterium]
MKTIRVAYSFVLLLLFQATPAMAQGFGGAMALGENTIFVGEARNTNFPGSVYVYADDEKPGTWIETTRL